MTCDSDLSLVFTKQKKLFFIVLCGSLTMSSMSPYQFEPRRLSASAKRPNVLPEHGGGGNANAKF